MNKSAVLVLVACATLSAFADKVYLKSGSFLTGKVTAATREEVTFASDDLGPVTIKVAQIAKIEDAGSHVVERNDRTTETRKLAVADGRYVADGQPLDISDVRAIDPVAETWHGSVNGAFTAARGNTYENSWSVLGNLSRRWERDRLNFNGGYYYSKTGTADGERQTSTDRWEFEGQEDHFWLNSVYSYVNARYDRDTVAELNARYRLGLGVGYQWLDKYVHEATGTWSFNQEAGVNWIKEEYENNEDQKNDGFAALRYAHHLNYLPKWNADVEGFHNCEFLPDVDDWEKYLVKADIGFTTKLIGDFDLLAKIEWDFNSMPANSRKKSDIRYIVGLGYKW